MDLVKLKKDEKKSSTSIGRYKRDAYNDVQVQYCLSFNIGCTIIYTEILNIANKWLQIKSNSHYPLNVMKYKIENFVNELREWQREKNSAINFCVLCEVIKRGNNRKLAYYNLMPKSFLHKSIPIPIPDDFDIENVIL